MRSVRLDKELDKRLDEAAKLCGEPVSSFIRDALRRRCDQVLGDRLDLRLADVVGSISGRSNPGRARNAGKEFVKILQEKRKMRR